MKESQYSPDLIQSLQDKILRLELFAEITKKAISILDLDILLDTIVNLIRDLTHEYHIFLYLLDDSEKWAAIRAGTFDVGNFLLKRKYRVEVENPTLVGWCIRNRKARTVIEGQKDAEEFSNPLKPILPECRCVVGIPLISRGEVIGAIEMHIWDFDRYLPEYQMMADHIAIAIDNARQFSELKEIAESAKKKAI